MRGRSDSNYLEKTSGILRTALGTNLVSLGVTTPYLVYLLATSSLVEVTLRDWGALAGIALMGFLFLLTFFKALQLGPVAIVSPVSSSYAVVTVLLAVIFLGERLSAGQSIGIAATMVGVALASLSLRDFRAGSRLIGTGVHLALFSSIGFGALAYAVGAISQDLGWFIPVYGLNLITVGILTPAALFRRELHWRHLTRVLLGGIVLIGTLDAVSFFAFTRGSEVGIISIVVAASAAHAGVPVVGGLLILKERLTANQALGLALLVGGVLALSLSP